ncbi:MAG: asparagine synthase (glutamine-hydrolyzing) [Lachnospiraceae bacterium]|nr:asparagine synthase (glutamine-hydrolyzing) [Lachnospiraceae bacterium]
MCGITGFCDYTENYLTKEPHWINLLKNMRETLIHRGKDNFGEWLNEHVGFAHARLSIRDIDGGSQPMLRQKSQKEYAIMYNGEIYNTDELIPELKKAGYQFKTTSDTEVILYAYMHYGPEFVKKLNGIFSFAIWDGRSETLILYRDRVGTKPLFYTLQGNTLIFGSEPKALFAHPKVTPKINTDSLRELLALGPAHTPGNGIFCGMKEVLPGHFLSFSRLGFIDHTYWDLKSHPHTDSYEKTVETVSFLVKDAIRRQMVSDVPVCTFLSGGIDSSIVTAVAVNHLKEQGETLNTFSFDFEENDKYFESNAFQPERDLPYVNIMLQNYHTNHTFLECQQSTLFERLYDSVDAKDMPGMTDIDASLLYFCSLVAKQNKVALTGECADEIFGGYPWFYREELLNKDGFPWSHDINARTLFLDEGICKELELKDYSYSRYQDSLKKVPALDGESPEETRRRQIGYLNIKWFMQTLLDRMDRTSMHSGLEARVPFADHRIIDYVFNVPWKMKYQNGIEKALLREACKDLLPPALLNRKKSPYPKTYHPGYERLLTNQLTSIVNNPNAPITPFIDKEKALTFITSHKELGKPWYGQLMAGPQLMAYYIQLNYWMEKYHLSL